jgi:hypothetical protein
LAAQARGKYVRSPEEYQNFAAKCLHLSRTINDLNAKAVLLKMAETWIKLAERLRAKAEKEAA